MRVGGYNKSRDLKGVEREGQYLPTSAEKRIQIPTIHQTGPTSFLDCPLPLSPSYTHARTHSSSQPVIPRHTVRVLFSNNSRYVLHLEIYIYLEIHGRSGTNVVLLICRGITEIHLNALCLFACVCVGACACVCRSAPCFPPHTYI